MKSLRRLTCLVIAAALFALACGSESSNNSVQNVSFNINANGNGNFQRSSNMNNKTEPANLVSDHLNEAFDVWSPEHEDAVSTTNLKHMWTESTGNHPADYYPRGVRKLIATIKENNYFKDCDKAKDLRENQFEPGGGPIQSVGNLRDQLYRCDPNNPI